MYNEKYFEALKIIYDLLKMIQDTISFPIDISLTLIKDKGFKLSITYRNSTVNINLYLRELFIDNLSLQELFNKIIQDVKRCLGEEEKQQEAGIFFNF